MNGLRNSYIEWNKLETEKQIYINAYMWNQWSYLQSTNSDIDSENKQVDTMGESKGWMNWEIGMNRYTLMILCIK